MGWSTKGLIFILLTAILLAVPVSFAEVVGTTIVNGSQSSYTPSNTPSNTSTVAGGITPANFSTTGSTNKWAGFYGHVQGFLLLADSAGNQFLNWTMTNPSGSYIYAAPTNSITWPSAGGAWTPATESNQPAYVISDANDNYNKTFKYTIDANVSTPEYIILNGTNTSHSFSNGAESTTLITYALYDGSNPVYSTPVYNNVASYIAGENVDYQLVVPANSTATVYYFWLELP